MFFATKLHLFCISAHLNIKISLLNIVILIKNHLFCFKSKTMPENKKDNILKRIAFFYIEGFRNMTLGKTLWLLIIIKLFIMFAILKLFFFPDLLNTLYDNDEDRAQHVRTELLK